MPTITDYQRRAILREIPAASNETLNIWCKVYYYDKEIIEAIAQEYYIRQIA
jgi:hypothetical protein